MMRYRIAWKNKSNGLTGHGDWREMTQAVADGIAETSNQLYPLVHHWAEEESLAGFQKDLTRINGRVFLPSGIGKGETPPCVSHPKGGGNKNSAIIILYRP